VTLLVYMERRAFQSLKEQPGTYEQRLEKVTARLLERHADKFAHNQKRKTKNPKVYWRYATWLKATKDFPAWLVSVIDD